MAGTRIFRWKDAPLAWRLLLGELTQDRAPRAHLALVTHDDRAHWANPARLPVEWSDVLHATVPNADGLAVIRSGDLLVAGNDPSSASQSADSATPSGPSSSPGSGGGKKPPKP